MHVVYGLIPACGPTRLFTKSRFAHPQRTHVGWAATPPKLMISIAAAYAGKMRSHRRPKKRQ